MLKAPICVLVKLVVREHMPSLTHLAPLLDLENFLDEKQSLSNSYARKICGAFC
jgi:hypothetical protein